jgi:hypothetical protein
LTEQSFSHEFHTQNLQIRHWYYIRSAL